MTQSKADAPFFAEKCMLDDDVRYDIRNLVGDLREVVMVRDPRDFLCSAKEFWKFDTKRAMQALQQSVPIYERVHQARGADTLFVRYEDLIRRSKETLSTIAGHFGLKRWMTTSRMKRYLQSMRLALARQIPSGAGRQTWMRPRSNNARDFPAHSWIGLATKFDRESVNGRAG